MKIEGGCLCGKVRYSADAEPIFVGMCHCTNCQKASGSAFNIVVALPKPAVSLQGMVATFEGRGDSGKADIPTVLPDVRLADRVRGRGDAGRRHDPRRHAR